MRCMAHPDLPGTADLTSWLAKQGEALDAPFDKGDQAGLHAGALGRRQLLQDLFLIRFVEAFQQLDGVVGFELADTFGTTHALNQVTGSSVPAPNLQ
jgi:hypothetical protein